MSRSNTLCHLTNIRRCITFQLLNATPFSMRLFLMLAGVLFLGACVPNRKVTLLQKNDISDKSLPIDTIVRSYQPDSFEYPVQPNDLLSIRFESLTQEKFDFLGEAGVVQNLNITPTSAPLIGELVDEDGNVPFPVIGKIKVSGLTVFQIQDTLQRIADQYLESPIVKVRLLNYRFTILGEVEKEGTVTLSNNRVTMIEAIGQAGGLGELADRTNIKLIRNTGGRTTVQYINLLDENFINSPYYYVYQNDVLIIPALPQKPFRKYFGQNLSLVVSTLSLLLLALNLTR